MDTLQFPIASEKRKELGMDLTKEERDPYPNLKEEIKALEMERSPMFMNW